MRRTRYQQGNLQLVAVSYTHLTHEEIGRITHAIRGDMKQDGELERGMVFERHAPLQWTEAQKKDLSNYQEGQILQFHRSSHGISKHEALVVERANASHIVARDQHGICLLYTSRCV